MKYLLWFLAILLLISAGVGFADVPPRSAMIAQWLFIASLIALVLTGTARLRR